MKTIVFNHFLLKIRHTGLTDHVKIPDLMDNFLFPGMPLQILKVTGCNLSSDQLVTVNTLVHFHTESQSLWQEAEIIITLISVL